MSEEVLDEGKSGPAGLSKQTKKEIRETFDSLDIDGSGTVEIQEMMQELDRDKNGSVDFYDFQYMMSIKIKEREKEEWEAKERERKEKLMKVFQMIDEDNKGMITVADIKRIVNELDEKFSDLEIEAMIEEAELEDDDEVYEQDFVDMMQNGY
ncbi:hypothetical protein SAY86_017009 [Trapa natans]|uniref:EF-hand domain-containing protein n=1 Tax=Trapa natans TaxID=22666 RepID=A0AAN7LP93_TRANT|nr:hypothetical protein SAY86_017009 [Trapa natans]